MLDEILQAAQKYCEQELYIIPVKRDKTPSTPHGIKDATNDFNTFLKMYKDGYGIGLLTGPINNRYVVDADVEKDADHRPIIKDGNVIKTGYLNFSNKFLSSQNKQEFETWTQKTQSGGTQFLYQLRQGQKPLKTHLSALPKLDLKGEGGYVVVAPSLGQFGKYEVISAQPVAFMPNLLYDFWYDIDLPDDSNETIIPINFKDSTIEMLIKAIAEVFKHPNGKGNEMLMAFSGAMALRGISIEHTKEILKEAAIINHWQKVDYDVVNNSYTKVKNHQKVLGYTTFKRLITENREQYSNFDEVINNLSSIFENSETRFYDIDGHNAKHFNKGKSIKFVMAKFPYLYTDEFDNLYFFSDLDGWHNDIENEIKKFIQTTDDSISEHNINEIISGIKHITYNKTFKNNKLPNNLIPIPAGLYNVENHTLEKHSKCYFYSNIKRNFIPKIEENSLVFSKFLDHVLMNPERDKNTIYQGFAWSLLNDNNIQGMLIFYGEGGNGKGIIQNEVIKALLGLENVAMSDLARIANYTFELQALINKRAILFSESIKGVTYNWQILKRITGHDYETIPIKNHPPILSQYQSAVILSTNELIPPKDELAIWRRVINIVEFNNSLNSLDSDEISKIVSELSEPEELDRLFSYILEQIYPNFLAHGFTHRYNLTAAKEKYLMKSNPGITYLKLKEAKEEILTAPEDVINYCREHSYDQNSCYYIDKNGNDTIFQIKETLLKQVNAFCSLNHLPQYDVHDRNSQTKIGQAIHYMGLEVSEYRKRMSGKLIHAWAGIFIPPDDTDLKIPEEEESMESKENKNSELTDELKARATEKIFTLLDSTHAPVHELDNIRRNLNCLSDEQFKILIDALLKSSIVKMDGRRLEKVRGESS